MKLNELPDWEKPREKLMREGAQALTNAEILAVLIRTGTMKKTAMDLAGEILAWDQSRGIRYLVDCSPEELRCIDGLGDAKICAILAAVELGRRIAQEQPKKYGVISCSDDVAAMYMESMRYHSREHVMCLLMDTRGRIIEETELSVGDLISASANPREIFSRAIRRSASCMILLHNHPSGDPTPSDDDVKTTRRLREAGDLMGIPLLDHIIIGDGTYTSLKQMKVL